MNYLIVRNIFFTILQPGVVVGLIPYGIIQYSHTFDWKFLTGFDYFGVLLFAIGFLVVLHCIYHFITIGKGTLSPADPTKNLVIKGLYKFSRNPMYVGVITMLLGETIYTKSVYLLGYTFVVFMGFDLYIRHVEEPRLKKDFGENYEKYKNRVRRWV